MTERRVTLSLMFTTDQPAGPLLTHVLSLLDPATTAALSATNTYAFDPTDHTDETRAFVVLDPDEKTMQVHIDDEDAATAHAKSAGGLLIELPVTEDYRNLTATKES